MQFVLEAFKLLFFIIDVGIYGFIEFIYGVFMYIAQAKLFSNDVIKEFYGRIFLILGLFMIFKLTFSMVQMLLNPDDMSDSQKGVGNIIKRIGVVIVMLTMVTTIFDMAYELQGIILKDNILARIILTPTSATAQSDEQKKEDGLSQGGNTVNLDTMGGQMSITAFSSFFVSTMPSKYNVVERCVNPVTGEVNMWKLWDWVNAKEDGEYVIAYYFLFSSAAGVILALVLINFCIDLGVRLVKLGFLQLIAPVPIISYMDPKGDKIFKAWGNSCLWTYLDVFIRLIAIYFALFIISQVMISVL
ncbi:MAG: hypothetical protein Q4G04_03355 [bacterium]|nr:hypothetical protein [bacterium]